ncbi:MAG: transaldolase family protein, partial [Spirochaetota bacterium]
MSEYKSPLHQTVESTPTDLWNDSCSKEELIYSIEHGASGATTNPTIVTGVLKKELHLWEEGIRELVRTLPEATEVDIAWRLNEEMALAGGRLLLPIFEKSGGKKGRISIQTNGQYYRSAQLLSEQARYFESLAPNIMVKMPATQAGIAAMEEATYHGCNINATVCFTLPQSLAVAEAVERAFR